MRWLVAVMVVACSSEQRTAITPPIGGEPVAIDAATDAAIDALTLDAPLAALRARGFDRAADTIARRSAQTASKMRLDADQALAAATVLLALADREAFRALHDVMPRSTVELARATTERGVTIEDAEAIARYLVRVVTALKLERPDVFDENHSHVTGREWSEIDYSGEGMTWQEQRDDWTPRGVTSFKRADFIHAYFVAAERLPHWARVYRPRGKMKDLQ